MKRLLVVEDQPKDLRFAVETARSLGVAEVDTRSTLPAALTYIDKGLAGDGPLPSGILLDLDLGHESGYELLRYRLQTPRLSQIPIIVWSVLGDEQREMCSLFKVTSYVAKWEGDDAFREALARLDSSTG